MGRCGEYKGDGYGNQDADDGPTRGRIGLVTDDETVVYPAAGLRPATR